MSDVRDEGAVPDAVTAPPRHPNSTVEPHSEAAKPSTHLDSQFLQDGNGGNGGDAREVAKDQSGESERTVLLEPVDPVEVERNDGPSPEVADVQLEHAGPVVQEHLVEHEPQSLLASDATPAREPVQQEAGRLAPGTDEQTLLGSPSPNLYGEPTPPARTVDLPAAPLLSPDLDLPAPVSQAPVPSLAPASPRNLHIRTQPADLIATPRELNSTTPNGSVPSTPISPSGGDAGHDGSTEDNDEDDERPLWDRLAAGQQRGRGEDYRPEAGPIHDGRYEGTSPVVETPRESTDESDRAVRSEESDAVEALDPSAIASSRARPPSASQPPPFVAPPRFTDGASQELPSTSFPPNGRAGNGARPHGRSQSVALPTSGPTSPGGSPFQSTLSSALGPPSHRTSEHRYRASSAVAGAVAPATNGVSASRSPSTGTAPSSSLAREASLRASSRADSGSQPPSRQASISADGRHVPASEGQVSRSASRRTAPSSAAAGEGSSHTVVHGARSRRTLGEWQLTKTLGAGSMGKVKLGVSQVTGEKVAIKIIPRFTSTASAHRQAEQSQQPQPGDAGAPAPSSKKPDPTASFIVKAAAKDASKEIRTVREGSLCLLLHHPYICGMREMLVYPHHYYFVQEYVNGGQMLDYIIAHGRLRERSARKFARQIGSALEYCHANSIVHRDLKIENILISKTGNIKIIDFGLSNLYSPASHLSTFCGSLYFAAPELLNAKPYTGPEVDVWSFGIVLYVLVCGKVPFDDQSMPALHAKIKRGQVEYPAWLSSECKHLLSRMLVTVPSQRATLQEVLNHPWVVKGFPSAPAAHIPTRAPLRLGELDADVIRGMTGFEFGTEEEIGAKLAEVIQSDSYRQAVRNWESKRNAYGFGGAADAGSASDSDRERPAMRTDGKDMRRSPSSKRFSGLGFYGKKLAGGFNAAFAGASAPAPKAYNELEPGAAASSETTFVVNGVALRPESLDPTRGFHPLLSIYYLVKEKIDRERIWGPGVFASSTLSLTGPPPPPAPAQAYATGSPHVTTPVSLDARPAMPTPPMPITPQPRQRAMGDFATMPASAPARPNEFSSTNKRASYFGQTASPASPAIPSFRPPAEYEMPGSPTPRERKASNRMSLMLGSSTSERDRASEQPSGLAVPNDDIPLATISQSASSPGGFARRFSSLLGKSSPDANGYKGHRTRASIATTGHKSTTKTAASPLPQVAEGEPVGALRPPLPTRLPSSGSDVPLASPPAGKPVARASTMGEISPSRHQRGVSMAVPPSAAAMGASPLSQSVGTDASADSSRTASRERRRQGDMFDDLEEEELAAPAGPTGAGEAAQPASAAADEGQTASVRSSKHDKSESAKPVWLKGLFSVSTTSTKPIATLRADLVRVLDRLGVQHRDVKNGYECAHVPSIDLSSFGGANESASAKDKRGGTVRRRASKLLLPTNRASEAGDSSHSLPPTSPIEGRNGNSFAGGVPASSRTDADGNGSANPAAKADMIVRFEIFLVKMPLLPGIHGLQFRRIGGDAWQYQMLARRVLQELKL